MNVNVNCERLVNAGVTILTLDLTIGHWGYRASLRYSYDLW